MVFDNLELKSFAELAKIEDRFICGKCKSSRKFFCYTCCTAHPEFVGEIPRVDVCELS